MNKHTWLCIIIGILALITGVFIGWSSNSNTIQNYPPVTDILIPQRSSYPIRMEMISSDPKIILLHNFLSPEECDTIIKLGETHGFARSTVQGASKNEVSTDRTSHTINLHRHQDALVKIIEQRVTLFCPFGVENVENLQIVRYHPGQQYKHHYDFFVPGAKGTEIALKRGGQRHVTFFVYLNDLDIEDSGGYTDFPRVGVKVKPRKGTATLWYNVKNGKEDFRTFHAGMPPLKSTKYGLNIWVRENPFQ
jgi:prolyl 4-hydroxylase